MKTPSSFKIINNEDSDTIIAQRQYLHPISGEWTNLAPYIVLESNDRIDLSVISSHPEIKAHDTRVIIQQRRPIPS